MCTHTHLHAPRPQSCSRICSSTAFCLSGVVLNVNHAHLTDQTLSMLCFGNAATDVIQENSSMDQKHSQQLSRSCGKEKFVQTQTMQESCTYPALYFQPGEEKCVLCSPLQGGRWEVVGGRNPELLLLQLEATRIYHGTGAQKNAYWHASSDPGLLLSAYVRWDRGEGHRNWCWILGDCGAAVVSLGSVFCPACSRHTLATFHGD